MADIDDLKSLSPEERIKKLKELEDKKKKEIEEAKKLIKESQSEISEETKKKMQLPIDQLKSMDIDSLLSDEEKEIFQAKRFIPTKKKIEKKEKTVESQEIPLEFTVEAEKPKVPVEEIEKQQQQYLLRLSQEPMHDLYGKVREMRVSVEEKGYVSPQQAYEMTQIYGALQRKEEQAAAGEYNAPDSKRLEKETDAAKRMIDDILGIYKG